MFSAADQRDMLEEVGVSASVPVAGGGTASLYVLPNLDTQVELAGGEVIQTPRYALAAAADIEDYGMVGDQDDGTLITIQAQTLRITSIEPRRDGFVTLLLGDTES